MSERSRRRYFRFLVLPALAGAALLTAWPVSAGDATGYLHLASRPSGVAVPPPVPGLRTLMLWRHQYEWAGALGPSDDPAQAGASGRVLELTEVGDDGATPGRTLWTLAFPYEDAGPRPLRSEDVTWDLRGKTAWVFTCACGVAEAEVDAWRVTPTPTAPIRTDAKLDHWPPIPDSASRHVVKLLGWRGARVDRLRASPVGNNFVIALCSTGAKATLWLSFDPEAAAWSQLELKPSAPPAAVR